MDVEKDRRRSKPRKKLSFSIVFYRGSNILSGKISGKGLKGTWNRNKGCKGHFFLERFISQRFLSGKSYGARQRIEIPGEVNWKRVPGKKEYKGRFWVVVNFSIGEAVF